MEITAIEIPTKSRFNEPSAPEEARPGGHLLPLPGSSFGVWPWAVVRGAGFPAELVLRLGAPATAALVEQALDAEGDAVPYARFDPARREALLAAFAADNTRIAVELRATANDPRFREAVTWQNRNALHTGLDVLARKPVHGGNNKVRQKERLVASYLQRYCVKNDTIGFFGPVCWARVASGSEALQVGPGAGLLARRTVYFEHWCIDAIAEKIAMDAELCAWAPPRLQPYVRVEDARVQIPFLGSVEMSAGQIAVLAACDGVTSARAIAARITARPELGMSAEAVLAFLGQAKSMTLVGWDFAVALQLHPERALRRMLDRIEDPTLRARALSPLEAMEAARARVTAAAGDAVALDDALGALESTFRETTGLSPTRSEGQVYAARTLLYEDGQRAADVTLGGPLLEKLGPPLGLLLASARWLTREVAARFRADLVALYDRLAVSGGPIALAACHKAFLESEPSLVDRGMSLSPTIVEVQRELQARWATILPLPSDARRVRFASKDLRPAVLSAFAAEGPGWEMARYVAPDVMIVADSVEAVNRGDFHLVLGEVHLSNTLATSLFIAQHPELDDLQRIVNQDLAEPQVIPVLPKREWSQRTNQVLLASHDLRYAFSPDPSPAAPSGTLRVADLVVVKEAGALVVRSLDGAYRGDMVEFMGLLLTMMSLNALQILPDRDHLPRVTIDEVTIARESFRFEATSLDFARIIDPLARWVELKRWQRAHGLPRFVFLKAPVEKKPCFIDLDSPIYVEMLAKLVRQTADSGPGQKIRLSEMFPSFEHVFFPDAAGNRYTSELRMVMVDDRGSASPR